MKCLILAAGYATRLYPLTRGISRNRFWRSGREIHPWLVGGWSGGHRRHWRICGDFPTTSLHQHFEDWKSNKQKTRPYEITVIDDGTSTNETHLGAVKDIQLAWKLNLADDLLVMAGDNVLDFSLSKFVDFSKEKNTSVWCAMRKTNWKSSRKQQSSRSITRIWLRAMRKSQRNQKEIWLCRRLLLSCLWCKADSGSSGERLRLWRTGQLCGLVEQAGTVTRLRHAG